MRALHARRMHEHLAPGTRRRHVAGRGAVDLEGDVGLVLVVVGPQHRIQQQPEPRQDAVLIRILDLVEQRVPVRDESRSRAAGRRRIGVKPRVEKVEQEARGHRVRRQRRFHAALREGEADLLQPAEHRAQQPAFPPGEARAQHEPVEPVRLRPALQQRRQRFQQRGEALTVAPNGAPSRQRRAGRARIRAASPPSPALRARADKASPPPPAGRGSRTAAARRPAAAARRD